MTTFEERMAADDVDFNVGNNGTRVRIEGSLSAEQAMRLAALLAETKATR